MAKYLVRWTGTIAGELIVEADSPQEAQEAFCNMNGDTAMESHFDHRLQAETAREVDLAWVDGADPEVQAELDREVAELDDTEPTDTSQESDHDAGHHHVHLPTRQRNPPNAGVREEETR